MLARRWKAHSLRLCLCFVIPNPTHPSPPFRVPPTLYATRLPGFRAAVTASWETTPQLVLALIATIAMILPALVVRRFPAIKPATIAATWAAIVLVISCINCVQLAPAYPKLLPPLDPEEDVSAQYENAAQIYLLPLGYVSFLGYVTPRLVWLFLLCPLLMLLTGVASAKALKIFFPFGFVRCARGAARTRGGGISRIV